MLVHQLIEELKTFPQNARVVLNGYEGGYGDVKEEYISIVPLKLNVNDNWYYGEHEIPDNLEDGYDCTAVLIAR